ncbi:tripartite transporter [Actibacterium mucosum KCTC 23349]|uniref:Tripartite transporter n=1 Tax=Actibacterium mucosum KCTC 23349 TaxID=1454373 RepID=A0A037ZL12_9RHOB|nr:TRAP transporter large permease subunit [Actibacterium mucosum]KAJ56309.1 tripartite transporter [Actibacterium mucosum KCTC 23349]
MSSEVLLVSFLFLAAFGTVLGGIPVAFALGGAGIWMAFVAQFFGLFDFSTFAAVPSRIFGTAMFNEVLTAVPLFILMGVIMERSRVAEDLLTNMGRVAKRLPAGLGISVTLVGALLAASTGIVGATVVAMGLLSLPTMLKQGYSPSLASGSICAAGTLGQIIPPSIVLVFLGDQLSGAYMEAQREIGNFSPDPVSVGDLFAGAMIPGIGLACLYMLYQFVIGLLRPQDCPPVKDDDDDIITAGQIMFALIPPITLIIAVLGSILAGIATPTEAAGVGATGALLLAGLRLSADQGRPVIRLLIGVSIVAAFTLPLLRSVADLRMTVEVVTTWNIICFVLALAASTVLALGIIASLLVLLRAKFLDQIVMNTMRVSTLAFAILIGATIFSLIFRSFGGDEVVTHAMEQIPGGTYGALIAVSLLVFVLGFFLDFIEIVFIIMPIVAPVILQSDINPVWFGVLIAMNLQTSFLTPPFGFALFYLRGVAPPEVKTIDIYRGVLPFIAIQIAAFILVFSFPALATWLPSVIYR